ncbi:MAG: hypothetical protein ABI972_05365 [Acidobacteriota bacterium]
MALEMDTTAGRSGPQLWPVHPNIAPAINHNIVRAEIEGGVHLDEVAPWTVLEIQTHHRVYTMVVLDPHRALILGHPEYCQEPVEVRVHGRIVLRAHWMVMARGTSVMSVGVNWSDK